MSNSGIEPYDWFRRAFGDTNFPFLSRRGSGNDDWFSNLPRQFEQMRREMETMFQEQFTDIDKTKIPKDLIKEYQTPEGAKVREVGPLVYGYSMTVGPDGKPIVREFGNIRSPTAMGFASRPLISGETDPLADITTTDKDVKVVVEMPGIEKKDIKINAHDDTVEVFTTDTAQRKYRKIIELPSEADIETARSTYKNGILEIVFSKKTKPKGRQINVE
ncbi:MAG TPA: archaeal heat shock protein Hsp20 [Nitrososphaeraceae archaeon]|nr:archaeal heat shock protein Hsp20 [Nitrososphaeraceae archaeon]